MKKKILLTVLALATILFSIPYFGVAFAEPPTPISGTIEFVSVVPAGPPKVAGKSDNRIRMFTIVEEWSGDIEGIGTAEAKWIIHNAPLFSPDAWVNAYAIITFTDVTVLGRSGSLIIKLVMAEAEGSGHWTIMEGTGELANIHGQGKGSIATEPFTYTGLVNFDP
jgi:hypothetical protein